MGKPFGLLLVAALVALPLGGITARAQGLAPEARERLVSVTGEGVVRAKPDMALITLGTVSEAKSARDALTANNASLTRILSALRQAGLADRDLQTSGFTVSPIYSQPPPNYDGSQPFRPEIVGYQVMNNLTVRIRDLESVGAILDQVVTLGANSISGPSFTVANPAPLEDQARRAATRDALRKGNLYADAAEVELGPIFRIEENFVGPPRPYGAPMMRMEAAADSSVPIEGGELTFQSQVSISWSLVD